MRKHLFCFATLLFIPVVLLRAQVENREEVIFQPIKIDVSDDGFRYLRFLFWNQMWLSHTHNNPESMDVKGNRQEYSQDIGIRRARIMMIAQMTPRFMFLTHIGMDDQNFSSGGSSGNLGNGSSTSGQGGKRPELYLHDVWGDYSVYRSQLRVGIGLHYWNGISRFTNASTISMMTLDAPNFNWPNLDASDQVGRQIGFFAHGELGHFNYRFSVSKPFAYGIRPSRVTSTVAQNVLSDDWSTQAYAFYEFLDREGSLLPYLTGTYLGSRRVLNIGAGYYAQPNYTANRSPIDSSLQLNNELILGFDLYADIPINKQRKSAINFYSVYYISDFGPGYVRNLGTLNPAPDVLTDRFPHSWAGGGNAQPTMGTGNTFYAQLGYLFPQLKNGTAFMPYATFTNKNFDYFAKASNQFDLGLNYFLHGHNIKLTAQYSTRPVYVVDSTSTTPRQIEDRGQFIFQTQFFL